MILIKIKKKLIENDKARFNAILFIVIIFYSLFLIRFTNKNNLKLPSRKDTKIMLSFNLEASDPGKLYERLDKNYKSKSHNMKSKDGKIPIESRNFNYKNSKKSKYKTSSKSLEVIKNIQYNYDLQIREHIENSKYYPISARRRNIEAKIQVKFTLQKNGKLEGKIKISVPSDYEILNDAALETIRRADPFPPFPDYIDEEKMEFNVYIKYDLAD